MIAATAACNDRSQADQADREQERKIGAPDDDAGQDEQRHAGGQQPEQQFLAAVVLARFRHVVVIAIHHFADMAQPFPVGRRHDVQLPETEKHQRQKKRHQHPDEGMQDARPDAAAEQLAERVEGRMEESQPGQRQQDEAYRRQPSGWRARKAYSGPGLSESCFIFELLLDLFRDLVGALRDVVEQGADGDACRGQRRPAAWRRPSTGRPSG